MTEEELGYKPETSGYGPIRIFKPETDGFNHWDE